MIFDVGLFRLDIWQFSVDLFPCTCGCAVDGVDEVDGVDSFACIVPGFRSKV